MKTLSLVALVLLSGCASQDIQWGGGPGPESFAKDDYACRKDAAAYGGTVLVPMGNFVVAKQRPDGSVYRMCMQAAGYSQTK